MTPAQRKQLAATIARLIGLETVWRDRSRPYVPPTARAICLLSTASQVDVGALVDIRRDYSADRPIGEEIHETINAVRTFTVTVLCESFEQSDEGDATAHLERLRTRLSARSVGDELRAVGLVIEGAEASIDLSAVRDSRQVSIAAFDLRMRTVASETFDRVGYIEDVEIVDNFS